MSYRNRYPTADEETGRDGGSYGTISTPKGECVGGLVGAYAKSGTFAEATSDPARGGVVVRAGAIEISHTQFQNPTSSSLLQRSGIVRSGRFDTMGIAKTGRR